ncbi:MAG: replication-associated recombination protein A [bacterium]|nr:replication-associated recombination protein A [bacterium]
MDLFRESENNAIAAHSPLAVRMRPRSIDDVLGQDEFLGPDKMLRRILTAGSLSSLIFYGPPGTGKTTLSHVIATQCDCEFYTLNGASTSVKDVRTIIEQARGTLASTGRRTVAFIDELHRFNRAQQDVLLNDVENGCIILVGATTENPYFTVNTPLLSRSTIFEFSPLKEEHIIELLKRAISDSDRGLGELNIHADDDALDHLANISDGDARRALTALEVGVMSQPRVGKKQKIVFDLQAAQESIQTKVIKYDSHGDEHYDAASALIKSMRGSDPDAAVYWLAKMLAAGEDPRFIARRVAILASEDIGNADPRAIQVAAAAYTITERIGMPECQLTLAQAVIYMACSPKSNASAMAIWSASSDVKTHRTTPVPVSIKDAHYGGAKKLGRGEGYQYSHDHPGGISPDQDYLGVEATYYQPTNRGYEKHITAYLDWAKKLRTTGTQK